MNPAPQHDSTQNRLFFGPHWSDSFARLVAVHIAVHGAECVAFDRFSAPISFDAVQGSSGSDCWPATTTELPGRSPTHAFDVHERHGLLVGHLRIWARDRIDARRLKDFEATVADYFECHRCFHALTRLSVEAARSGSVRDVITKLLRRSAWLARADRADVFWYGEEAEQEAAELLELGPTEVSFAPADAPPRSISRNVLSSGQAQALTDVHSAADYFQRHPATVSELAIPLFLPHREKPVGVLNLEWFQRFECDGLDFAVARKLAEVALATSQAISQRTSLTQSVRHSADNEITGLLSELFRIDGRHNVDSGVVWRIDSSGRNLECLLVRIPGRSEKFNVSLPLDGPSFAASVAQKGETSINHGSTEKIDTEAFQKFGACFPLVGVPIKHEGKTIGVLVAWNGENKDSKSDHDLDTGLLEAFAVPIGVILGLERHRFAYQTALNLVIQTLQRPSSEQERADALFAAFHELGLETVRWFRYDRESRNFVLQAHSPANHCEEGIVVNPSEVVCARELLDRAFSQGPESGLCRARQCGDSDLEPNPISQKVNRKPGTPWIEVPLVIDGRLIGYLAAHSNGVGGYSPFILDAATTLGVLWSQGTRFDDLLGLVENVSHKVLSPLGVCLENVQPLADPIEGKPLDVFRNRVKPQTEYVQYLNTWCARMLQSIRANQTAVRTQVDVGKVIDDLVGVYRRFHAIEKNLTVTFECFAASPILTGNESQIAFMIDNLLSNAVQTSPISATIRVQLRSPRPGAIEIAVGDQGPGIDTHPSQQLGYKNAGLNSGRLTRFGSGRGIWLVERNLVNYGGILKYGRSADGFFEATLRLHDARPH